MSYSESPALQNSQEMNHGHLPMVTQTKQSICPLGPQSLLLIFLVTYFKKERRGFCPSLPLNCVWDTISFSVMREVTLPTPSRAQPDWSWGTSQQGLFVCHYENTL